MALATTQNRQDTWTQTLPEIRVPAARMFGSASRFSNIYAPTVENILLDAECLPSQPATITVKKRLTRSFLEQRAAGRKAALRHLKEKISDGPVLKLGERVVYDARWIFNGNLAHLIGNHVGNLAYVKETAGIGNDRLAVILEKNSSPLSHKLFKLIGYETIETNRPVEANVVEVDFDHDVSYHLVPYISKVEPPGLKPGTFDKVFISRKTSRRITNESEIIAITRAHGYETFYFEDIPMHEQWPLIRDAKNIVSVHGAALGYLNTKFGYPGSRYKLLEIFSPGLVCDCYRKSTAVLGGHWVGCRGKVTADFMKCVEESVDYKAMDAADFHLDPKALEKAFVEIEKLPA
jgi:hypothetical protein